MARRLLLVAVTALALAVAGCGNRHDEPRTFAETEGIYLEIGGLHYQVQISRQLNPNDAEDSDYLHGLPETESGPADDEAWFGVFLRVENQTEEPLEAADEFEIVDTEEQTFEPVELDPEVNAYAFDVDTLQPGRLYPAPDSTPGSGPIKGSLLLFKLPYQSFQNRPLEFRIVPSSGDEGIVDLDV